MRDKENSGQKYLEELVSDKVLGKRERGNVWVNNVGSRWRV
jgi:hypothetical protein